MSTTANRVTTNATVTSLLDLAAKKQNISKPKYDVTHTMKKGDGYMSVIYDAKVKQNSKEVLSVIVKICPEGKMFRQQSNIRILYEHEILFYDEICPAFRKFQVERGIEEVFEFAPKCYATTLEEEKEGLVLENLRNKGYKVWNRMAPMDENHIELTLKAYAKFHALNFAFKDQHKEKFDEFCSKIQDIFEIYISNPMHKEVYERMFQGTISYFDPIKDKEYVEKFENYLESMKIKQELFYSKNMDKYSITGHGDCWCNNMMYKYDDASDPTKPTEIQLLDFQIIRCSTPIMDFTHFFYTSSPKKVQDNVEYYLKLYYDTLVDSVKQLGSDPEKVYPRSVFDAHWKKYCVNGVNVAMFMIKLMTSESDEVPDFREVTDNESMMKTMEYEPKDSGYKKRVRDVIVHFYEKGFI